MVVLSDAAPVLLVDDSSTSRLLVTRALLSAGVTRGAILSARNGVEALSVLDGQEPRLMVLDINMPELDGRELLRRLRDAGRLAQMTVVVLTSVSAVRDINHMFELGARAVMRKPLGVKELAQALRPYLGRPAVRSA